MKLPNVKHHAIHFNVLLLVLFAMLIAGCGGGSGGSPAPAKSPSPAPAQYTIGGTVSGLNGTVVLQNNSGDDLTLSAVSSFTFATKVAAGNTYSVSVLTQPINQICSVSTGAGTVYGGNVSNVVVVCSNIIYSVSVGGSISGLTGSVVIQNNSGDNLTVASNGTFTFATKIAYNSPYSVTVLTQPSSVQSCIVSNGNGTATANISDVSVNCALSAGPAAVTPTVVSSQQINLSWTYTPPVNDNSSGYAIFRKDGLTGFYKIVGSLPSSALTYNDLNLTPYTAYYYKIYYYYLTRTSTSTSPTASLINNEFRSDYSAEIKARTLFDLAIPNDPASLNATAPGGFKVNLTWTDNADNEAGFYIERSLNNITFTQIDSVQPNTTTYVDRQVVANKTYYYRVIAYNSFGYSTYSQVATATTPAVASTAIGGTLYTNDATLSLANSPYYAATSFTVLPGVTLTVEPGVEIRFAAAAGIEMRGALKAIGTATAPIIFTSASPDSATNTSWNGIHIARSLGGSGTFVFSNISFASTGISYDCYGCSGLIDISDSEFVSNSTAESFTSGIGYGQFHRDNVLRTLYTLNTFGIASSDMLVYYSMFKKNGTGLIAGPDIKYNIFDSNTSVGATATGVFQYNVITGSPIGYNNPYGSNIAFSYNLLTNCTVGFMGSVHPSGTPNLSATSPVNSNIFGNITYNYQLGDSSNVLLINNWWGITDPIAIKATIYDVYNNSSLGVATFQPYLLAPVDLLP